MWRGVGVCSEREGGMWGGAGERQIERERDLCKKFYKNHHFFLTFGP